MDFELIENIKKISFFDSKLEKVQELMKNENYKESYKAIATLIEIACIILLEKVYNVKVEDSNIIILDRILKQHDEEEIHQLLVDINGEYNYINLNEVDKLDNISLLSNLNQLIGFILNKHGNIFSY